MYTKFITAQLLKTLIVILGAKLILLGVDYDSGIMLGLGLLTTYNSITFKIIKDNDFWDNFN